MEAKLAEESAIGKVTRVKESELKIMEREEKRINKHAVERLIEEARTAEIRDELATQKMTMNKLERQYTRRTNWHLTK